MAATEGSQRRFPAALLGLLALAAVFRVAAALWAPPAGRRSAMIRWVTAGRARDLAGRLGRPVLYDFGADWCVPCRRLDEEVFSETSAAALINESFVPVSVVDRMEEEGRNSPVVEDLQHRFAVDGFPTLVVVRPDGAVAGRLSGFPGRDRVLEFLRASSRGLTPP